MKNLEQTVPASSAWKIICSGTFSVFAGLCTQTPNQALWPHVDLTSHFEADLLGQSGVRQRALFGKFK